MNHQALIQIIEEKLDLSLLTQEMKDTIIVSLSDAILERTMLAIIESLTEEEAVLANSLILEGKIEDFLKILNEYHPELNEIVVTITNSVIEEFLKESRK